VIVIGLTIMTCRSIRIRTSIWSYVILAGIVSPPLLIGPAYIGFAAYVESGYWKAHLPLLLMALGFFVWLYQDIRISGSLIEQVKWTIGGRSTKAIAIDDIDYWVAGHPCRVVSRTGEEITIPWTSFNRSDQKLLFDTLDSLQLTRRS
jgi:hypothetical protein